MTSRPPTGRPRARWPASWTRWGLAGTGVMPAGAPEALAWVRPWGTDCTSLTVTLSAAARLSQTHATQPSPHHAPQGRIRPTAPHTASTTRLLSIPHPTRTPPQMVVMNAELMGAWHSEMAEQMASVASKMEVRRWPLDRATGRALLGWRGRLKSPAPLQPSAPRLRPRVCGGPALSFPAAAASCPTARLHPPNFLSPKALAEENTRLRDEVASLKGGSTPTNGSELSVRSCHWLYDASCRCSHVWRPAPPQSHALSRPISNVCIVFKASNSLRNQWHLAPYSPSLPSCPTCRPSKSVCATRRPAAPAPAPPTAPAATRRRSAALSSRRPRRRVAAAGCGRARGAGGAHSPPQVRRRAWLQLLWRQKPGCPLGTAPWRCLPCHSQGLPLASPTLPTLPRQTPRPARRRLLTAADPWRQPRWRAARRSLDNLWRRRTARRPTGAHLGPGVTLRRLWHREPRARRAAPGLGARRRRARGGGWRV
jgi:hypothetical protein